MNDDTKRKGKSKTKSDDTGKSSGATQRQLLFYEQATPLSKERHAKWAVELGRNYAFARSTNSVPLTRVEFARAAKEYPIVFAGPEAEPFPLVILGLADRQNLFIAADGGWSGDYVPAFVRRYPFVFTSLDDGQTFTLCVDEAFSGCNEDGRGEQLFDDKGNTTRYLDNVLAFLREYQAEHLRTQAFARRMATLELLEPVQANVEMTSGQKLALTDFKVVSRTRLKQIGDTALREMFTSDDLELVYLHLQSMQAFAGLIARLPKQDEAQDTLTSTTPNTNEAG
ncbi:MAG: hypothetical protein ACI8W7_003521 [Gammaproteobacteria bacterium]|jgi:hypothetical protein